MGFARTPAPHVIEASKGARVYQFIGEREIAAVMGAADPFNVANRCPVNATGHQPIPSCADVVCGHCGKVFWR